MLEIDAFGPSRRPRRAAIRPAEARPPTGEKDISPSPGHEQDRGCPPGCAAPGAYARQISPDLTGASSPVRTNDFDAGKLAAQLEAAVRRWRFSAGADGRMLARCTEIAVMLGDCSGNSVQDRWDDFERTSGGSSTIVTPRWRRAPS